MGFTLKVLLSGLFVLMCFSVFGQNNNGVGTTKDRTYYRGQLAADSIFQAPQDTLKTRLAKNGGNIAFKNNIPYYYNGTAYVAFGSGGGGSGTVTSIATSAPLTGGTITTSGTIGMTQAGLAQNGWLSSVDFTTFNNKLNAADSNTLGGYMTRWWLAHNGIDFENGVQVHFLDISGNELVHINKDYVLVQDALNTTGTEIGKYSINFNRPSAYMTFAPRLFTGAQSVFIQSHSHTLADSARVQELVDSVAGLVPPAPNLQAVCDVGSTTTTPINNLTITDNGGGSTLDIAATKTLTVTDDATVSGTNTGDQIIVATGDATGTWLGGSLPLVLANVNSNVGTYNNITINAKGQATAGSNVSYLTALPSLTDGYIWIGSGLNVATGTPMSGDATMSSTGALTLASTAVTPGTYGSSTLIPSVTVDQKGRITGVTTYTFSASGGDGWTIYSFTGGDFSTTSTSLVDVTGFVTSTLDASSVYDIEVYFNCGVSAAASGLRVAIEIAETPTKFDLIYSGPTTTGAAGVSSSNISNGASMSFLTTASLNGIIRATGSIITSATPGAFLQVRMQKMTSGTAIMYADGYTCIKLKKR